MKPLLDTHALLWFIGNDPQLSTVAREDIENPASQTCVSAASLWEIAIKLCLRKVRLPRPFGEIFPQQLEINGFALLPISCALLSSLMTLPFHHRDPFDRLSIAQAIADGMVIVTRDQEFSKHPAKFYGDFSR